MKYKKADYGKPLEECSKRAKPDEASEYDTMLAISHMPAEFTDAQLRKELHLILVNKGLSSLVDKGLIEAAWDPKTESISYYPRGS